MDISKNMKWFLGLMAVLVLFLTSGCAGFGGARFPAPCDNTCQIRKDCELKASQVSEKEYKEWLRQMTESTYYNYENICADIP